MLGICIKKSQRRHELITKYHADSSQTLYTPGNTLQSADKDQQEMRAVADKPHDARYRNVQ